MRCCKHYSPNNTDMENHDGLGISEDYEFDKLLNYPACGNKEVTNGDPFGGCPFARNQDKCNFYSSENPEVLWLFYVGDVQLQLETVRVTFGIIEFYVVRIDKDDTREVIHTINAHEHGENSKKMAEEAFRSELKNLSINTVPVEADLPERNHPSYILEVTNGIPTPA